MLTSHKSTTMKLELEILLIDASLHVPTEEYDEEGNVIGENPDFHQMMEEAKGKSFIRIVGTDATDPSSPKRLAFESGNGTDIQSMIRSCFDSMGRATAKRFADTLTP